MATSLGSVTGTVTNSNTQLKGAKINVRLYETKWASGKTKVTWYVDLLGRSESPTKAKTSFKLVITLATGSKITDVTGTSYSSGSEIVSYNNNKSVLSGSCYVFHNNAGAAKITVKISDSSVGGYSANASGSFSLTNNKPFTACGAPTSVTINKSIVLPQDTIKVSWSGATAGTGNPISGYIVYYNISATGANPTTSSTKSAKLSSSTKSYEITFDAPSKIEKPIDEVRGYKIVCGVIAVGTEDGYDSSMKYSSPIVINSLPKLSVTISDEKEIIPSTGGTVTFNLSATDTNNQTLNYFYATTENAENKELATSKIEIEIKDKSPGTEIPYYFWASDGLEFSEPVRKTIMINNPPEFEVTIEGTELSSINAKTDAQYIIQPTIAINNFTKQENRTYAFSYNVISSIDKNFTESSSKLIEENTSQESISLQDIREYLENFQENGKYYRISVSCSDGIEIVTKTSDIKYVTKVPSLIGLYNKSNNSNISGYYSISNIASYY